MATNRGLGGDIPWAAGVLMAMGAVAATILRFIYDIASHRHQAR